LSQIHWIDVEYVDMHSLSGDASRRNPECRLREIALAKKHWKDLIRCAHALLRIQSFFFQAEDRIRDRTVTGVQTCALPISLAAPRLVAGALASAAAALIFVIPLRAITAGELDGNRHPGVVLLLMEVNGQPAFRCSGKIGRASCRERERMWGEWVVMMR